MAKIGSLAVESSVWMNVNGVRTEFVIIHQGNPDPSLYDASCDGTWVMMKDIYESRQWHSSNSNAYANSTIHSYLNSTFLNLFEADIKAQIKQVKIPYVNGTGSSAVASGANGLSCKIFLLSGYEVGWTTSDNSYFPVDGAKLDYFTASSGGNSKRIANLNGSATLWWLRSPYTYHASNVWLVRTNGNCDNYHGASDSRGIRPACILPSNLLVDDSSNVTAEEAPPPVQCRIPRKMTTKKTVEVRLNGTFNSSYVYATIGGTKYSKIATLRSVESGTDAQVTVVTDGTTSSKKKGTKITLDGVEVKNASSNGRASYDFTITDECLIEGGYVSASGQNTIAITMPY